jgi:hypothetical protein
MGEAKIDLIQGAQPKLGLARLSEERLEEVADVFRSRGLAILNEQSH